jgi:hypothetical protein
MFSGITSLNIDSGRSPFAGSMLSTLRLPCNIRQMIFTFIDITLNMEVLEFPTSLVDIVELRAKGYIGKIVINSVPTRFVPNYSTASSISGISKQTYVINAASVIPISGENTDKNEYYVPDDLLDAYKAATNWSNITTHIHPMSDLPD